MHLTCNEDFVGSTPSCGFLTLDLEERMEEEKFTEEEKALLKMACNTTAVVSLNHGHKEQYDLFARLADKVGRILKPTPDLEDR